MGHQKVRLVIRAYKKLPAILSVEEVLASKKCWRTSRELPAALSVVSVKEAAPQRGAMCIETTMYGPHPVECSIKPDGC
jgi:hypothetical protein